MRIVPGPGVDPHEAQQIVREIIGRRGEGPDRNPGSSPPKAGGILKEIVTGAGGADHQEPEDSGKPQGSAPGGGGILDQLR
jgi:hypothetical protein